VTFRDLFSPRAELYARYRPKYPPELFDWIASIAPGRDVAWDCATGNGQAATALAYRFHKVVATDASSSQIEQAEPHERVLYRVATAYESGLGDASVDVVTVAQALHWFDFERFYAEARRVVKPEGAIVIWGYGDPVIDDEEINRIVHEYNRGTVERYWQPERMTLLRGYSDIPFPFREIAAPSINMKVEWTLEEFAGLLRTWSATAAYAAEIRKDPVVEVERDLAHHWKTEERHVVSWPLFIRAGLS
jgi:ubiquinone/menaquinone biosynthesis C-methylase UbiE